MSAEMAPRAGDRVLLSATITRVGQRDDKRLVCTVDIHNCCLAAIAPENVHSVIYQKIKAGDRVCWKNTDMPRHGQALNRYGKVLYVEAAFEEDKRPEMALVAPEGGYRDRPYLPTADLERVISALIPEPMHVEPLLPTLEEEVAARTDAEEVAGKPPIPPDVYWNDEASHFYNQDTLANMGSGFRKRWSARRAEFPTKGNKT